jgi:hypothetical protein
MAGLTVASRVRVEALQFAFGEEMNKLGDVRHPSTAFFVKD